jgi:hypothetical protein
MDATNPNHKRHRESIGFDWYKVGRWGALGIIGYFLLTEHRAHVIQFLPFLLLLACPFMHMFMHHGDHGSHKETQEKDRN